VLRQYIRRKMPLGRLSPGRREVCATRKTGAQSWNLLFVHWVVDVAAIRPLVPATLAIDIFEGRVSLGPIRVRDFLEVNLRTYVPADGVPGVWFFSLDAESRVAVWVDARCFALPYFSARMACERAGGGGELDLLHQGPQPRVCLTTRRHRARRNLRQELVSCALRTQQATPQTPRASHLFGTGSMFKRPCSRNYCSSAVSR
jgi:hypothetical protein